MKMERYGNRDGNSGVEAFAIEKNAVVVKFRTSDALYRYSHASAGKGRVETMKRLAREGRGLSTFISQYVHDLYER